jgi:hypothetical protein
MEDAIVNDQVTPETQNDTPVEITNGSSYDAQAREMGWRPKDEWEGEPDKWRDAKEFVERGELYGKIDSVNRELKETRKALKMLQEHHSQVREAEYKRAVEELKAEQKKHLEAGNADEYLKTTELLTDLKAEQKARQVVEETTPKAQPGLDPRFVEWSKENTWYDKNQDMHDFADTIGSGFASRNPGVDPVEVLKYVTREVKKHFKENFENPNRTKPTAVSTDNAAGTGKKQELVLTDEEKRVMNTFLRQNIMTKEAYLEQVKLMKGMK